KLRKAETRFQPNLSWLEQDVSASKALTRIQEVLAAPSPYGLVKEVEGLIQQIAQVNDALIAEHRARVLPEIDKQVGKVQIELDAAQADHDLRNQCLYPLQQLKKQVETQTSLAHIDQAGSRAVDLVDQAFAKLEEAVKPPPKKPGGGNVNDVTQPKPYVKLRRVIKPSALAPEGYLETQADIDAYLDRLRGALEKVVAAGDRIEIR
ncbi:MAG: hypothetical protein VBE63_27245, partial [Lamprobacter sp.]|nr:hypothetical protein [Lamprobacter sp.]